MHRAASACGASTPFPRLVSRAARHGRPAMHISAAAPPPGSPAATIRSSTSCFGAPAIRVPNSMAPIARGTTSIAIRFLPLTPIRANGAGIISSDRTTGKLLVAKRFVQTSWAKEIGPNGRPIVLNETGSSDCLPDQLGATNFMPSSFDPALKLSFVTARESCSTWTYWKPEYARGEGYRGGASKKVGAIYSALRAIDPTTGERRWEFRYTPSSPEGGLGLAGGVMSTASGLVFAGDADGNFSAFDARTGKNLWHYQAGGSVRATAITYMLDGRQYVLIPSGTILTAFALPGT